MSGLTYRPATEADLDACGQVWRLSLNDYLPGVGQPPMPEDVSGLRRLHAHLLATDPDLFWVAERDGRVVAFTAATLRGDVWFLSMLFVLPDEQKTGVGSALLARTLPPSGDGRTIAVGSDSAFPPSNGLYARLGMPARMPLWLATGRPRPGWRPPALPAGITPETISGDTDGRVTAGLQAELDALDRETIGLERPLDHEFVRRGRARGWAYRDGSGGLAGYGYVAASGRISPAGVREPALLAPVIGHLLTAYEPPGASAIWLPGGSDGAIEVVLGAGLRLEGFPILFGWSRPFADFSRYLPISPGLL